MRNWTKKSLIYFYVSLAFIFAGVLQFQNCSDVNFSKMVPKSSAGTAAALAASDVFCSFNGQTYKNGDSVTAWQNSSVPADQTCVSELRICDGGTFSGTFQFPSCDVNGHPSCTFNGKSYPSGSTITAFQNSAVPYGQVCQSTPRTCHDGVWDGKDYNFPDCVVGGPASCVFNGKVYTQGQSVVAYQNATVPFGQSCLMETQVCDNSTWISDHHYTFPGCTVDGPKSCLLNGKTIANDQVVTVFQASTVPFGQTCTSTQSKCVNGAMSSPWTFESCSVGGPASCTFNGQTVADGQTVMGFLTSTVPYGQTCSPVPNTCNNGLMSRPDAIYGACAPNEPKSCLFNGQTIGSGQTVVAFSTSTVPYGQTCTPQTLTCTNGAFNPSSSTYPYSSCAPQAPVSCIFDGLQVADGQTVPGYTTTTVNYPESCVAQTSSATCHNGVMSGGAKTRSCVVAKTPSTGQHCDIGGSWGWRSSNFTCPAGKKPISATAVGGCPAGSSPYNLNGQVGCYYSNKDSRRPVECANADPVDECCFWICDGGGQDSSWTCYPQYQANGDSGDPTYIMDYCYDQFGRTKNVYNPPAAPTSPGGNNYEPPGSPNPDGPTSW